MVDEAKWKRGLLASNLPLESEAARLLATRGFTVESDFQFPSPDPAAAGDLSVALHARAWTPSSQARRPTAALELLIECRHRPPDAHWLCLPDLNPPDAASASQGCSIRLFDEFSLYAAESKAAAEFDVGMPICHKGLEIDAADGGVAAAPLTSALELLQSALPRLLSESIRFQLAAGVKRSVPFLLCPVLVTTARLLVADQHLGEKDVCQASRLDDLADEVPYVVMISDCGPGFQAQCRREFHELEPLARSEEFTLIEDRRARHFKAEKKLPYSMVESLMAAERHWLRRLFTRSILCTKSRLPSLIDALKQTAEKAMQSPTELP